MAEVVNPFATADGAARYAAGRPFLHPLLVQRLEPWLQARALGADVACGTGLSSLALAGLVERVLAYDASPAILAHAAPHPRVSDAPAPAEHLPLSDHTLDVITVAQAFHWFRRDAFLAEARRNLKPDGVLFLYDFFFMGQLPGRQDFKEAMSAYGARYPTPPRHRDPFGEAEARAAGFSLNTEAFTVTWTFNLPQLVLYLMTHSNTIAASDAGRESPQEIQRWLTGQLTPFFQGVEQRDLLFTAQAMVLRPLG